MNAQRPDRRPPDWRSRRRPLVAVVLAAAILAAVLVASDSGFALRPFVVFLFLVLGPGLAVTGFLRLNEPATELAVAIPLSLALDVAVAAGMSLATAWHPDLALIGSVLVAGAALALQLYRFRPAAESATEPAAESATEPAAKPATELAAQSATEPAVEPAAVPAAEPANPPAKGSDPRIT